MAERIEISSGETGSEAPNQPIYEGYAPNESEAQAEGEAQHAPEQVPFVPEKFISEDGSIDVESLAKSYSELERLQGDMQPQQDMPENTEEMQQGSEGTIVSSDELQGFAEEVLQEGNLTDESYSSLEARGLPRELVQAYVEGQQALMTQARQQFVAVAGGEEGYNKMSEWAGENLAADELQAYNDAIQSGDTATMMMTIQGLKARYDQVSSQPNLISGDVGTAGATQGFTSWKQVTQAMKDNRYQDDPAYRAEVANRLALSDLQ